MTVVSVQVLSGRQFRILYLCSQAWSAGIINLIISNKQASIATSYPNYVRLIECGKGR